MAQDFEMYAGDTKSIRVTITDSGGDAVNLSGSTLRYVICRTADGTPIIDKSTDDDITVSSNVATIPLPAAETEALVGGYYHELELTDTLGTVSTLFVGSVYVRPSAA